jgi:hypothetical protein
MKEPIAICNLADHNTKVRLMKDAIETLSKDPDMGIVVALLICSFIDSLAETSHAIPYQYLQDHFPEFEKEIGFIMISKHLRNKAIHKFAILPPLGLAHSDYFSDPNDYKIEKEIEHQNWTFLNVDRLTKDFLDHLTKIKK